MPAIQLGGRLIPFADQPSSTDSPADFFCALARNANNANTKPIPQQRSASEVGHIADPADILAAAARPARVQSADFCHAVFPCLTSIICFADIFSNLAPSCVRLVRFVHCSKMPRSIVNDLSAWRLFLESAKYRSFRKAALSADADPSSVSRRIAQLEENLGVALFDASGRYLKLTEHGRMALRVIEPLIAQANEALKEIQSGELKPTRQLHVLASAGFQNAFLWRAIAQYGEQHPDIHFWVETFRQGDSFFDQLGHGVDIIVTAFFQDNANLHIRKVSSHAKVCVASPGFVKRAGGIASPEDLRRLPLAANVHFMRSLTLTHQSGRIFTERFPYAMICDNSSFLADWAAGGHGVFLGCPSTIAADFIREGRLQRILADWSLSVLEGWAYASAGSCLAPSSPILPFLDFLAVKNTEVIADARHALAAA